MPEVVGVRFKRAGKIYDFDTAGLPLKKGDIVVVESDFGLSLGKVVKEKGFVEQQERPLKQVIRLATEEDFKAAQDNKQLEQEAFQFCLERIKARGMQMKLICTEATLDRKRIVFFFTADGRVDFRELVKDLAARFRTRIEMRQVGVRDEAKMVGGIGICGRELCCCTFLTTFEPVAIKMAKDQELVLNVAKLSGLCGRLMCCLRYEFEGDIKDITTEDEVIPQEELMVEDRDEPTMASILSTIDEEEKDTEQVELSDQEAEEQPTLDTNEPSPEEGNNEAIASDLEPNREGRPDYKRRFDRKGFKRRKYFKR